MSRLALLVLVLCAACAGRAPAPITPATSTPPTVAPPPDAGLERLLDATVGIVDDEGRPYCAGVMVSPRLVATAAHCVDNPGLGKTVQVGWRAAFVRGPVGPDEEDTDDFTWGRFGWSWTYRVDQLDLEGDVAVLRWAEEGMPPQHEEAQIRATPVYRGMAVVAVGHPSRVGYWVTTGVVNDPVTYIQSDTDVYEAMALSLLLWGGNSGGPVVDRQGQVVSLVSAGFDHMPWVSFGTTQAAVARAVAAATAAGRP